MKEQTITFTKKEWDEHIEEMIKFSYQAYEQGVKDTKEAYCIEL